LDRYGRALALVSDRALPADVRSDSACTGVVIASERSCHETNAAFDATLLEKGPRLASPQLFPYTLPGSAASEIGILCHARGPTVVFPGGPETALVAFITASDFLHSGMAERVLLASADVLGPATLADWPAPVSPMQPWAEAAVAMLLASPSSSNPGPRREVTPVLGPALADVSTLVELAHHALADAEMRPEELAEIVCPAQAPHHEFEVAAATKLAADVPILSMAFKWGDAGAPLGLLSVLSTWDEDTPRLILTRGRSGSVAMVIRS